MLKSIHIQNYRNLSDLEIKSLGAVNLFTGKNNTGKTTLLEAIAIFTSGANFELILNTLIERGQFNQNDHESSPIGKKREQESFKAISSLFNRETFQFGESVLKISDQEHFVSLTFVTFYEIEETDNNGGTFKKRVYVKNEFNDQSLLQDELKFGVEITQNVNGKQQKRLFQLEYKLSGYSVIQDGNDNPLQFIRTQNNDRGINGRHWDNITLTDKENFVIDALKIIEPKTEGIAFVNESKFERSVVVKLSDSNLILPLKSMGDGINRILTIILALVNAENGYLLIDEFENGLHYSVQEQLWKIIFELSAKLNVQVFVTTHSEDSIRGFEQVLNDHSNKTEGKLIRLDNVNGEIKEVEYTASDLKIATDNDIEVR